MTQSTFKLPSPSEVQRKATVLIEIFGEEELVAASGQCPVHAVDNAMRNILEKHHSQLTEVCLEAFDVRLLHGSTQDDDE